MKLILIESRPFSAEIGLAGRENGVRRDRMLCSKSFEIQEVRQIGWMEARES